MSNLDDTDFEALAARLIAQAKPDDGDAEAAERAELARWQAALHRRRMSALAVGKFPARLMAPLDGSDLAETPSMVTSRAFVADATKSALLLLGGVGCGKSTAAAWVAYQRGGDRPGFVTAAEFERRGRYDHEFTGWLFGCSALVIDDLGVEPLDGKGYFRALLDELLNAYYADARRLVITANLRLQREDGVHEDQFAERYGARVLSRVLEVGTVGKGGNVDLRRRR